jgi:hypothetical protein
MAGSAGIGAEAGALARRFAALRLAGAAALRAPFFAFFAFLALRFAGARRDAAARFFAALRVAFFFAGAFFFFALRAMRISVE